MLSPFQIGIIPEKKLFQQSVLSDFSGYKYTHGSYRARERTAKEGEHSWTLRRAGMKGNEGDVSGGNAVGSYPKKGTLRMKRQEARQESGLFIFIQERYIVFPAG